MQTICQSNIIWICIAYNLLRKPGRKSRRTFPKINQSFTNDIHYWNVGQKYEAKEKAELWNGLSGARVLVNRSDIGNSKTITETYGLKYSRDLKFQLKQVNALYNTKYFCRWPKKMRYDHTTNSFQFHKPPHLCSLLLSRGCSNYNSLSVTYPPLKSLKTMTRLLEIQERTELMCIREKVL